MNPKSIRLSAKAIVLVLLCAHCPDSCAHCPDRAISKDLLISRSNHRNVNGR